MSDEVAVRHRVPPYVLVSGPESLLAERGVAQTLDDLKVTRARPRDDPPLRRRLHRR